jgi:hypothetical protein
VITNSEFQNTIQVKTLAEISMVSKLAREKLNPVVFKNIEIVARSIKFESNVLSIANEHQIKYEDSPEYDYQALKDKHKGSIQESFNEYDIRVKYVKKHASRFHLYEMKNSGYYLYPLINGFNNLTTLAIVVCNVPFAAFVEIGKTLPNLDLLDIGIVNLVKSSTDTIASSDIFFPPNLTSLIIGGIQVATTDLLMDPYEYLFNFKENNYSYEHFIIPKHPLPSLKYFKYYPSFEISDSDIEEYLGVEEFLDSNPKLETLTVGGYNLKMNSSLNSLEILDIDDNICFNSISNIPSLGSINTLRFFLSNFENTKNFRKLCMLCSNLVELNLYKNSIFDDPQALIDEFLKPGLPKLSKLKTLKLSCILNNRFHNIFDFNKFTQIEELIIIQYGPIPNIKFDGCKNLKRVEFYIQDEDPNEFMEELSNYKGWTFKYEDSVIFGNKI